MRDNSEDELDPAVSQQALQEEFSFRIILHSSNRYVRRLS